MNMASSLFCLFMFIMLNSLFYPLQAYVQQLESSRLKLTQLEQELQRARQQVCLQISSCYLFSWAALFVFIQFIGYHPHPIQGIFISSSGDQSHSMSGNGMFLLSLRVLLLCQQDNSISML